MKSLEVDLDLVRKYNVAGPRYTSYPSATRFTDQFRWPDLAEEILENNKADRDLSLYFHVPFCRSLCWYCGCTTVITQSHRKGAVYLNYLKKELERMTTMMNPRRKVTVTYERKLLRTWVDAVKGLMGEVVRTEKRIERW